MLSLSPSGLNYRDYHVWFNRVTQVMQAKSRAQNDTIHITYPRDGSLFSASSQPFRTVHMDGMSSDRLQPSRMPFFLFLTSCFTTWKPRKQGLTNPDRHCRHSNNKKNGLVSLDSIEHTHAHSTDASWALGKVPHTTPHHAHLTQSVYSQSIVT